MNKELVGVICSVAAIVVFLWAVLRRARVGKDLDAAIEANKASWRGEDAAAWILEFIRFWRKPGFFEKFKELSEEDLVLQLSDMIVEECSMPFSPRDEFMEISVLMLDKDRFWFEDTEADVCMENKVYERIISEWAKISRGVFAPQELQEIWHSDKGPIEVHFKLNGEQHTLYPNYNDDWFDLPILIGINKLIKDTGTIFYVYVPDQCAGVIALTKDEHALIKKERKIKFDIL